MGKVQKNKIDETKIIHLVLKMQSDKMDVEPLRLPRRTEAINLLTGIFLKSVYFLNSECSKFITVGIFKNRGDALGVLFKGRKGVVYWSYDIFNQFAVHFSSVTEALEHRNKRQYFKIDDGGDIKIQSVFGKPCVFLYDGEHSLTLNTEEWGQFVNNLPLVHRSLRELFLNEIPVKDFIREFLDNRSDLDPQETLLSPILSDRLTDELELYKRGSNGGGD